MQAHYSSVTAMQKRLKIIFFFEFCNALQWDNKYLIQISMDGPNVNKLFHRKLADELFKLHGKKIIDIGTCNLHPVHTAFINGLKKIQFDFDKLPQNLHFFFKNSSARRHDYAEITEIEKQVEAYVMLRHVSSRWMSLKTVLQRIISQWTNLQHYFLVYLPKQKNFDQDIR